MREGRIRGGGSLDHGGQAGGPAVGFSPTGDALETHRKRTSLRSPGGGERTSADTGSKASVRACRPHLLDDSLNGSDYGLWLVPLDEVSRCFHDDPVSLGGSRGQLPMTVLPV